MQPHINLPAPYMPHAGLIAAFEACPLIAIMRGVTPADAAEHGQALYEAGFRIVEVPLNSPQPFDSIAAIRKALPADAIVGAGTVLHPSFVNDVKSAGGELIVMPHSDAEVVRAAKAQGTGLRAGRRDAERSVHRAEKRRRRAEDVPGRTTRLPGREGMARGDRGAKCRWCRSAGSRRTTWVRS